MMKRFTRLMFVGLAGASLLSACAGSGDESTSGEDIADARSARSRGTPEGAVKQALRGKGKGAAADQLHVVTQSNANGLTHLRMEQTADGFRVHGSYAKASVDAQANVVHMIDRVPGAANHPTPASVGESAALAATLAELGYDANSAGAAVKSAGNVTEFGRGNTFYRNPSVERVAYFDDAAGVLREGFLVETWSTVGNQLNHTLVDGKGLVVSTELRTANDSYNVFTVSPIETPQSVQPGKPHWLGTGAQTTVNISGNNAHAYLDKDANNAPDPGGTAVTDGNFLAALEDAAPGSATNEAVAVQNLFYLNNVVHDILYSHGFDEAAGNFQQDNFGLGGVGGDPVNAEAQDGSGTDNANFSTPADGSSGRMQMYLWTGAGPNAFVVGTSAQYGAWASSFGPALTTTGTASRPVVLANDGTNTASDGCEAFVNGAAVKGNIALVDRGTCNFTVKVRNAQSAGAIAVIIANNTTGGFSPGGTDHRVKIPSAMISQADRAAVLGITAKLAKNPVLPRQVDGDLDSGVVYHEYGHGLTWRMVGSMSGPLAGALGEGSSDVVAFLINDDPIMGAYAFSNALGIRRAPYDNYTLTYADVNGAEVHNDGEIWAAAVWQVKELYNLAGLTNADLLDDFVQGLNFTPAGPTYEQMRDGLLAQARLNGRQCMVWRGMAALGLGAGSSATVSRRGVVTTTPSSALGDGCTP